MKTVFRTSQRLFFSSSGIVRADSALPQIRKLAAAIGLGLVLGAGAAVSAAPLQSPSIDTAPLATIRDTAMQSDWAYARLADLTDLIGPRLSGSPGAAAAVEQVAAAMRSIGAKVTLQPVKVPYWVRGAESAELTDYAGRPAGLSQKVVLTALGGSGATPAEGLSASVIVVRSFEELQARRNEVKGSIVLFDVPFDQQMADRGFAGPAYGQAVKFRVGGPKIAAELGAAAALVRSVGGANFRIPHAGMTQLGDGEHIPAAAVTAEDAMLMSRLAARGPLRMHLTLTPQTLPDADGFNVIADLPGSDKADEIVIISGHLDSWDLATGANDDGTGVTTAMGVIDTLKKLKLRPRRTIRMIAWMNEENGGKGGQSYAQLNQATLEKHVGAIESDMGAGRPFGILAGVAPGSEKVYAPLQEVLQGIGAGVLTRRDVIGSGDLYSIEQGGVPCFEPQIDGHDYFNYHHTPADTLDKVDPDNLRRHVAVMATLAWFLANTDQPIGRAPGQAK
jgi:carboxypeptidase Q